MSYFTFASTEYDLPHPTLSRNQPRFYIPDRSSYSPAQSSAALAGEPLSMHSRMPSTSSTPYTGASTPYRRHGSLHGSGSRQSLAALRHALHSYHPHSAGREPLTPPHQLSRVPRGQCPPPPGALVCDSSSGDPGEFALGDPTASLPHDLWGIAGGEPMEALVDIHRVLYRGNEDAVGSATWSEQGREVRRVIDQWFEGDCVYDHPLVRLSSRQSMLTHFALLQFLATAYVPSFTPQSILLHARNLSSRVRGALLGSDDLPRRRREDNRVVDPVDEWLASSGHGHGPVMSRDNGDGGWWKLWDVSAECRDIGCMECYEGYHVALIDHVISLTLFPSVLKRQTYIYTPSTESSGALEAPRGFVRNLAETVLREFDFMLHWDLPVSTIVEFNEVGKATHVRDVVDVRDVIDTFVPFAKRFNWLSRRLTGIVTSTIGSVALTLVPGHTVVFGDPIRIMPPDKGKGKEEEAKLGSAIGLESPVDPRAELEKENSLGLEGMSSTSMAPDVDREQDA